MSLEPNPDVREKYFPDSFSKKGTCTTKLGSHRFHIPLTPRDSDPKDKDTRLLGPPSDGVTPKVWERSILGRVFLSAIQTVHSDDPCSVTTRK